jgi:hypothetical protein
MMNQFQMALLEHDFIIQYKKGSDMPADYLSRLPASTLDTSKEAVIVAFDPFQTNLPDLQREEPYIQNMLYYSKHHRACVPSRGQLNRRPLKKDVPRQRPNFMGQADGLQIPKNGITAAQEVPKGGPLRGPQQPAATTLT